ncbi:hypothetical protein FQN60_004874 [Etheostoma spectabile]|uniref:Uncharacterized protein n=1 Tax=Etheostoma spectabile TaxID=54343 RepID=A0A5J5DLF7_9PERO|nr:hypothetical protein FQN60_004874 [Etheostoma spectabile]
MPLLLAAGPALAEVVMGPLYTGPLHKQYMNDFKLMALRGQDDGSDVVRETCAVLVIGEEVVVCVRLAGTVSQPLSICKGRIAHRCEPRLRPKASSCSPCQPPDHLSDTLRPTHRLHITLVPPWVWMALDADGAASARPVGGF